MDITAATSLDHLRDLIHVLPGKKTPVVYVLRLRDRSLLIGTSQHLQWRLFQIVRAANGEEDSTASAAIRRCGGVSHVEAFTVTKTEASAKAMADKWTDAARKRGEKIATDGLTALTRDDTVRAAFGIGADGDF